MTPKEHVKYLRKCINRWQEIKEKHSSDESTEFGKLCDSKIHEAKNKIEQIVKKESPEDFLY
jgi:hypothetical protein